MSSQKGRVDCDRTLRVLFDIAHPAHVHVFKHAIAQLSQRGHQILVTSRQKECATELLAELGIPNRCLSVQHSGGALGMVIELVRRNIALARVARDFQPDVLVGVGGIFVAQVGRLLSIPSLVFYDTENARLQNLLTYPFASRVVVPECYDAWTPSSKTVRYRGYHELAYLRPNRFRPDHAIALRSGLGRGGDTFLIRSVSWQANHDVGEAGWTLEFLTQMIELLSVHGQVIVSSELTLPAELEQYRYHGGVENFHHLLAHCALCIGESATVASEAAVLGVPAIYVTKTSRGYIKEIEARYGLIRHLPEARIALVKEAITQMLKESRQAWQKRRQRLLDDTVDVADFIATQVAQAAFSQSKEKVRQE